MVDLMDARWAVLWADSWAAMRAGHWVALLVAEMDALTAVYSAGQWVSPWACY